jgi:hypothetical protein
MPTKATGPNVWSAWQAICQSSASNRDSNWGRRFFYGAGSDLTGQSARALLALSPRLSGRTTVDGNHF